MNCNFIKWAGCIWVPKQLLFTIRRTSPPGTVAGAIINWDGAKFVGSGTACGVPNRMHVQAQATPDDPFAFIDVTIDGVTQSFTAFAAICDEENFAMASGGTIITNWCAGPVNGTVRLNSL